MSTPWRNNCEIPRRSRPVVAVTKMVFQQQQHPVYYNPTWICVCPVPRINVQCKFGMGEGTIGRIPVPPVLRVTTVFLTEKQPNRRPRPTKNGKKNRITSNDEGMFSHPKAGYEWTNLHRSHQFLYGQCRYHHAGFKTWKNLSVPWLVWSCSHTLASIFMHGIERNFCSDNSLSLYTTVDTKQRPAALSFE